MTSTSINKPKDNLFYHDSYLNQKKLLDQFIIDFSNYITPYPEINEFIEGYNIRQTKFSKIIEDYGADCDSLFGCYMNTRGNLFYLDKLIKKYTPYTRTNTDKYKVDL